MSASSVRHITSPTTHLNVLVVEADVLVLDTHDRLSLAQRMQKGRAVLGADLDLTLALRRPLILSTATLGLSDGGHRGRAKA